MKAIFKNSFLFFVIIISVLVKSHFFSNNQNIVDAPAIFSFEELGYDNTIVKKSRVSKYKNSEQKNIDHYSLVLESEVVNENNLGMTIDLFYCENSEQSNKLFKELLRFRKDFINELTCKGICYHPVSTFESAIADMYKLNTEEWEIELGFSNINYHDIPKEFIGNYEIFILKNEYVLELTIDKKIKLDSQKISAIMNVFKRTKRLFIEE